MFQQILTFIVVALGITFSIFFHIFTKEHSQQEEIRLNGRQEGNMKWKDWFKEGQFYIVRRLLRDFNRYFVLKKTKYF